MYEEFMAWGRLEENIVGLYSALTMKERNKYSTTLSIKLGFTL